MKVLNIQNKRLLRLWLAMAKSFLLMSLRGVPITFGMTKQSINIRFLATLGMTLFFFVSQVIASETPVWITAEGEAYQSEVETPKEVMERALPEPTVVIGAKNEEWKISFDGKEIRISRSR